MGMWSGRCYAIAVFAVFTCLLASARADTDVHGSLRLVVQPEHKSVKVGGTLSVSVGLRDIHDQSARAPSAFDVTIVVTPADASAPPIVRIPAGQSTATLQLKPSKAGVLEIRATHPQAFEGGAFVRVSTRVSSTRSEPRKPAPPRTADRAAVVADAPPARVVIDPARVRRLPSPGLGSAATATPPPPGPGSAATATPPPLASGGGASLTPTGDASPVAPTVFTGESDMVASGPRLALRYSPHRKMLADGHDSVTIIVFGDDSDTSDAPEVTFKVNLFATAGTLAPRPLVVQGSEGQATLTSDRPGDIEVEFLGAQPSARLDGDQRLHIQFGPPIQGLRIEAKPAAISLVDETDLIVTLVDAAGRTVATDEERTVLLALDTGHGEIEHKQLVVKPREFEAHTRFVPTGVGGAIVSAASSSLLNQTAALDVRLPYGLLAISVTGGLVGGLLAFLRHRRAGRRRIVVGGITGFVLYWAFIFGLIRVLPHSFVLNPLSNFALSVIGGWFGTKMFDPLLNRLGLTKPRREPEGSAAEHAPEAAATHATAAEHPPEAAATHAAAAEHPPEAAATHAAAAEHARETAGPHAASG